MQLGEICPPVRNTYRPSAYRRARCKRQILRRLRQRSRDLPRRVGRLCIDCGFHLDKRRASGGFRSPLSRVVTLFGLAFGVRFAEDLLVLIGFRCHIAMLCDVRCGDVRFTTSCRFRRRIEQAGGLGRPGFRRSWCSRPRSGRFRRLGRGLLVVWLPGFFRASAPAAFEASSISALARLSEFSSSRWLETKRRSVCGSSLSRSPDRAR
jgi:hypothetical protein